MAGSGGRAGARDRLAGSAGRARLRAGTRHRRRRRLRAGTRHRLRRGRPRDGRGLGGARLRRDRRHRRTRVDRRHRRAGCDRIGHDGCPCAGSVAACTASAGAESAACCSSRESFGVSRSAQTTRSSSWRCRIVRRPLARGGRRSIAVDTSVQVTHRPAGVSIRSRIRPLQRWIGRYRVEPMSDRTELFGIFKASRSWHQTVQSTVERVCGAGAATYVKPPATRTGPAPHPGARRISADPELPHPSCSVRRLSPAGGRRAPTSSTSSAQAWATTSGWRRMIQCPPATGWMRRSLA